jgi:hypothetical protein
MSDAAIFATVFVGFFVLRIIAATLVFFYLLPKSDRCPMCDTPTIRVMSRGWNTLMPWLRTSWCYQCHWEGCLRHGDVTPPPAASLPRHRSSHSVATRKR